MQFWRHYQNTRNILLPLDQSAAYILGLFQKKISVFGPFGGNEKDLRGTKRAKIAPNVGAFSLWGGGASLLYNWAKNETFSQNVGSRSV